MCRTFALRTPERAYEQHPVSTHAAIPVSILRARPCGSKEISAQSERVVRDGDVRRAVARVGRVVRAADPEPYAKLFKRAHRERDVLACYRRGLVELMQDKLGTEGTRRLE